MTTPTKPRKLHSLQGTILYSFPRKVPTKGPHYHQPYYLLTVKLHNFFAPHQTDIYAFSAQVSRWNQFTSLLATKPTPTFSFYCEKRTRGWRLCDWKVIES